MRRYLLLTLLVIVLFFNNVCHIKASEFPPDVVITDHQMYTYGEMVDDIGILAAKYPGIITVSSMGTSSYGRNIPAVIIGNTNSSNKVLIQSTIHAREYICTLLTMEIIEYICDNYYSMEVNGIKYADLFSNVCFHIIPMVNPDGVEIAQRGYDGATSEASKEWLRSQVASGFQLERIKSNANGVDLNRNFPVGFGNAKKINFSPCFEFYPGGGPMDQAETCCLAQYSGRGFYAFINYHSCGQVIYYGAMLNTPENAVRAQTLASVLAGYNGYRLDYETYGNNIDGSFSDYVQNAYGRPSATVEIGTSSPTPISQFGNIFNANKDSWGGVAYAVYMGQF